MLDISSINVDVRFKRAENDEGGQRGNPGLSRSCKTKFNEAVAGEMFGGTEVGATA